MKQANEMTAPTHSTHWMTTMGPSLSISQTLHTLEWTCTRPLSGAQLASVCRVCETEGTNIHQLLYLAYDAAPAVLRLILKSDNSLVSLEQRILALLDNPS